MKSHKFIRHFCLIFSIVSGLFSSAYSLNGQQIPKDINAIFNKSVYQNAIWGLQAAILNLEINWY